jgi:hypothetical protein
VGLVGLMGFKFREKIYGRKFTICEKVFRASFEAELSNLGQI